MAKRNFETEVASLRAQLVDLQTERVKVESAALPRVERLAIAKARVNHERSLIDERALMAIFAREPHATHDLEHATRGLPSLAPLLAALLTEQLEAFLMSIGDAAAAYCGRELSNAEQKSRLLEIDDKILALERAEELVVRDAVDTGAPIRRRADASPQAVLARREPIPTPAAA